MQPGSRGPGHGGPFEADDPGEPVLVDGVVGHDVELAAVLEDAGDDARGDGPAVDDEVHLVVGDAMAVVDPRGAEDGQAQPKAASVQAPTAMWSGCPVMPSGPKPATTSGLSSARTSAMRAVSSSAGISLRPPSG